MCCYIIHEMYYLKYQNSFTFMPPKSHDEFKEAGYPYWKAAVAILLLVLVGVGPVSAARGAEDLDKAGLAVMEAGDFGSAVNFFDRAIALDPSYVPARLHKATALLSLRRPGEALLSLDVVLDSDPVNVDAWIYRGDALMALGRTGEAADSYRRAASIAPGNSLARERLAHLPTGGGGSHAPVPLHELILFAGAGIATFFSILLSHLVTKRKKGDGCPPNEMRAERNPSKKSILSLFPMRAAERTARNGEKDREKKSGLPSIVRLMRFRGENGAKGGSTGHGNGDQDANLKPPGVSTGADLSGNQGSPAGEIREEDRLISGFDKILAEVSIDVPGLKGIALYAMGKYEDALREFRKEREDPKVYEGIVPLEAATLMKLGRPQEALEVCESAIRNRMETFDIYKVLSSILVRMEKHEEAIAACDRALSMNPHSVDLWSLRAYALYAIHRDHEALQACERALGMDPHSAELVRQKSQILARLGRTGEALAIIEGGINTHPRDAGLLLEKARILLQSGHLQDAAAAVDSALSISPADPGCWEQLALVFRAMGDHAEEAAAWERVSALSPHKAKYLVPWGDALRDAGDIESAVRVHLRAAKEAPEDTGAWKALGKSLYKAGKFWDATRVFRVVTGKSPGDGEAWKCLGWAYLKSGMAEEARISFAKAGALLPEDKDVKEGLSRLARSPSPLAGNPGDATSGENQEGEDIPGTQRGSKEKVEIGDLDLQIVTNYCENGSQGKEPVAGFVKHGVKAPPPLHGGVAGMRARRNVP